MSADTGNFSFKEDYGDVKMMADMLLQKSGKTREELMQMKVHEPLAEKYWEAYTRNFGIYTPEDPNMPQIVYSFLTPEDTTLVDELENPNYYRTAVRRGFMYNMSLRDENGIMLTVLPQYAPEGKTRPASIMLRRGKKSNFNINEFARKFGKGGHEGAATIEFSVKTAVLEEFKKEHNITSNELALTLMIINSIYEKIKTDSQTATAQIQKGVE
jgi:nanoRNase/pAp phosphatase (c-di-AMP/oligoRNAs hydrolase)